MECRFPDGNVHFVGKKDKKLTGNFEVVLVETNELLFSMHNGGGMSKAQTTDEREAIAKKIEEVLL